MRILIGARRIVLVAGSVLALATFSVPFAVADPGCQGLPTAAQLRSFLAKAAAGTGISGPLGPGTGAGGLFGGSRSWAAVVNRDGKLCAFATSTADPSQVWPGSQAIAKAKAYTANAFSLDVLALSTARLYTFVQPGHSLFGLNQSNPFDPRFLAPPGGQWGERPDRGRHHYLRRRCAHLLRRRVGGLGVSGDTACTDHEIAKRMRDLAGLNSPGGPLVDDISYSSVDGASVFTHPVCLNTLRNGVTIGTENPATGY